MQTMLGINAIYRATEGEGVLIGTPQVFVRFQGCTIGCLNCDSKDTWDFRDSDNMVLDDVLAAIGRESLQGRIKRVSITGGDPLHPQHVPGVIELIKILKSKGYILNIEAAGTRVVPQVFDLLDFISFDVKTPSTGVKTPIGNLENLIEQYPGRFQIKAVIEDESDFMMVLDLYHQLGRPKVPWVLTPAYNLQEKFPQERFLKVIDLNQQHGAFFRVIGQQHKFLHGPDKKRV